MGKKLTIAAYLGIICFFLSFSTPAPTFAQTCSADLAALGCTICTGLGPLFQLQGQVMSCSLTSPDLPSYDLQLRWNGDIVDYNNSTVFRQKAEIVHKNKDGEAKFTAGPTPTQSWRCEFSSSPPYGFTCQTGKTERMYISYDPSPDPADYPGGFIRFEGSADILLKSDPQFSDIWCQQGTLSINSDSCVLGTAPGCNPDTTCGASGQCLTSQICSTSRKCEVSASCPCAPEGPDCGGGGCPPGYICFSAGQCITEPLCIPCTDTTGSCGGAGQCAPYEKCDKGTCKSAPECASPGTAKRQPIYCDYSNPPKVVSDPGPADNPNRLYTAIGCIHVNEVGEVVKFFLKWGIGLAGGIAFLMIVYAGILIKTSAGNANQIKAGQELIASAIMGLVMIIFSLYILNVIGVKILQIPGF